MLKAVTSAACSVEHPALAQAEQCGLPGMQLVPGVCFVDGSRKGAVLTEAQPSWRFCTSVAARTGAVCHEGYEVLGW